jgi:triosephosphate isomerase
VRILIVANWKCNPTTLKGTKLLFDSVKNGLQNIKNVEVVICPPFVYLPSLLEFLSTWIKIQVGLGAQDCFWEDQGAFTGEISPKMLKDLGVKYVIIGHSERRKYLNETDEMISKKIKAALKAKLKPILCIGETEKERKLGKTLQVLKKQLKMGLKNISNIELRTSNFILAYEPVWAIGTGKACQPEDAKKIYLFLRKILKKTPILYGGSVNSQNARDYIKIGKFQGLLVGGASLDAQEFVKIVKTIERI